MLQSVVVHALWTLYTKPFNLTMWYGGGKVRPRFEATRIALGLLLTIAIDKKDRVGTKMNFLLVSKYTHLILVNLGQKINWARKTGPDSYQVDEDAIPTAAHGHFIDHHLKQCPTLRDKILKVQRRIARFDYGKGVCVFSITTSVRLCFTTILSGSHKLQEFTSEEARHWAKRLAKKYMRVFYILRFCCPDQSPDFCPLRTRRLTAMAGRNFPWNRRMWHSS